MTETPKPTAKHPPWVSPGEGERLSFGTWLRRQRELREISLREIADFSKVSLRYLEALERDRFDVLPAQVFTQGFLREYARYVGLDADDVVNSFLTARQEAEPAEEAADRRKARKADGGRGRRAATLLAVAALALLLLVAALLVVRADRAGGAAIEAPPLIAAPPVASRLPSPAAAPRVTSLADPVDSVTSTASEELATVIPLFVTLDFSEDCWVEASVDGERRVSELRVQGESLRLRAEREVVIDLGNARGVRIEVNGRPLALPPSAGQGAGQELSIDVDTARALAS